MADFYPDAILEEVRSRNDIVEVLSEYLPLKKRGKNYVGLCPFHLEKTPSFTVSPDKQIFYCFGCGQGGNVITFLMRHEKMSFGEVVRFLAQRANIRLPSKPTQKFELYDQLYYANQLANEYFRLSLNQEVLGKKARDYLKKRGFEQKTIEKFSIGFIPDEWDGLIKFAATKKIKAEVLFDAGLVVEREKAEGYYDRFRKRIIFPIWNLSGKIIGFGGRILGEGEPKYLNTPETAIYQKGRILYGLNFTKEIISDLKSVVLVEGYVDFITLYQAGLRNLVASSGTAFTSEQARLLSRYSEKIYLIFDPDIAGQSAAIRSIDLLLEEGFEVFIVPLPKGEDPDSFVRKFGVEELNKKIENALGFIDFKKAALGKDFQQLTVREQEKFLEELNATIGKVGNEVRKTLLVKKAALSLGIEESLIWKSFKGKKKEFTSSKERTTPISALTGQAKIEAELLRILLEDEKIEKELLAQVSLEDFSSLENRKIFELIQTHHKEGKKISASSWLDEEIDENIKVRISQIAMVDLGTADLALLLSDYLKALQKTKKKNNLKILKQKINEALDKGEKEKADGLTQEYLRLKKTK
jgi:DNA primase